MNISTKIISLICLFNFTCVCSMERPYDIMQLKSIQESKKIEDSRLLLELPQDVLRSIIRYVGENYERSTFDILDCLKRVCKKLEQALSSPNELKIICCLSQENLDNSLNSYSLFFNPLDFTFLKSLVIMSANLTYRNQGDGKTCLHYISFSDDDNDKFGQYLAKLYLEHGAQVNQTDDKGNTPLHWAVERDKAGIVKELLAHNAQLDVKNNDGDMPINIALKYDRIEALKILIQHGGIDTTIPYAVFNKAFTIAEWARVFKYPEIYTLVAGEELSKPLWKTVSDSCVIS